MLHAEKRATLKSWEIMGLGTRLQGVLTYLDRDTEGRLVQQDHDTFSRCLRHNGSKPKFISALPASLMNRFINSSVFNSSDSVVNVLSTTPAIINNFSLLFGQLLLNQSFSAELCQCFVTSWGGHFFLK